MSGKASPVWLFWSAAILRRCGFSGCESPDSDTKAPVNQTHSKGNNQSGEESPHSRTTKRPPTGGPTRALLLAALLALTGCPSDPPKKSSKAPFSLDPPATLEVLNGTSVKQDVAVNWDRGEREDLEASAAVEPEGKGVTAKPDPAKLERGVGPLQVNVAVSETAAPGDYLLTLTVKGAKSGQSAKGEIKVRVPRRE